MKKLWHTPRYLEHQRRLAKREKRKRERKNRTKGPPGCPSGGALVRQQSRGYYDKDKRAFTHHAPSDFSIVANTEDVLRFFNDLRADLYRRRSVFIDLNQVTHMTPDAILYLLALLDFLNRKRPSTKISGNLPQEDECAKLMRESGFFQYVRKGHSLGASSTNTFKVRYGTKTKPQMIKELIEFARVHIPSLKPHDTRGVYSSLVEAMTNVRNHAYNKTEKWWMMAMKQGDGVCFAILDNGLGIPRTIKKNIRERLVPNDAHLIDSAMKGNLRTRTGEPWRGKGLPKILENLERGLIQDLHVVAQRGHYAAKNQNRKLRHKFQGTLISWNFIPPKGAQP